MDVTDQRSERDNGGPKGRRKPALLEAMVLTLLREANRPQKAYDIARRCGARGSSMTPMQAYRVLDRLIDRGEVQRIETLSSYVLRDGERKGFMICRDCGAVQAFALSPLMGALDYLGRVRAFSDWCPSVELTGVCRPCATVSEAVDKKRARPVGHRMAALLVWLFSAAAALGDLTVELA